VNHAGIELVSISNRSHHVRTFMAHILSVPPADTASPDDAVSTPGLSRRSVVAGAGVVAAAGLLTACGGGSTATAPGTPAAAAPPAAPATPAAPSAASSSGQALASTTDIPVGGGKVFADKDVVVTQPSSGEFKAFSATCTHMGCKVKTVANGTIDCPCHGSKFAIADGSVAGGPAKKPLPAKPVSVDGDSIVLDG
jgi:Rieske Fe-S protein